MNISIQNLFHNLAEEAKSSKGKGKVQRPIPPVPPAKLHIGRPAPPSHHFYTNAGSLGTLAKFDVPTLPSMQKMTAALQAVMTEDLLVRFQTGTPKTADAILATILQQCFDLLKDETRRERERKRRRNQQAEELEEEEKQTESEEKAKSLLQTLLSHASENEHNMPDFCKWARASVAQTQVMMEKQLGRLPEHTQKTFQIMNDAIEALEHGMTPENIMHRLDEVIKESGG